MSSGSFDPEKELLIVTLIYVITTLLQKLAKCVETPFYPKNEFLKKLNVLPRMSIVQCLGRRLV